jgi:predicted nucleic acid-binding protein
MSRFVVDASVALKWLLPEDHCEAARRLLADGHALFAPDLLFCEVGNALWKRVRRGELNSEDAESALTALGRIPLAVQPCAPLAVSALVITCHLRRTVYDSLYLALAVQQDASFATADERLVNALKSTPLASRVRWVEDIP